MANNLDLAINFKIITGDNNKTKDFEEFQKFIDEQKTSLELQDGNFLVYLIDNMYAEGNEANKAILLKLNDGETQVFYDSTDVFIKSKSKNDGHVTTSDYGLMSPNDYAILCNLDQNLNTEEATAIINNVNDVVKDIIEVDEDKTVTNTNKIYKFKDGKISTIDGILAKLEEANENLTDIQSFLSADNEILSNYTNLKEYIDETVKRSIDSIINEYINHTHIVKDNTVTD